MTHAPVYISEFRVCVQGIDPLWHTRLCISVNSGCACKALILYDTRACVYQWIQGVRARHWSFMTHAPVYISDFRVCVQGIDPLWHTHLCISVNSGCACKALILYDTRACVYQWIQGVRARHWSFMTHAPVHISEFRVCVQVMWNPQVKNQVTDMHKLKANSHCDTALFISVCDVTIALSWRPLVATIATTS